ncbi:MAG: SDR family oxidoreductase [Agriterribacter sp.]
MKDKICLITGATSGIGKITALELAKKGAHVIVHGRNAAKAETVRKEITAACGHNNVTVMLADLGSLQGVKQLADQFSAQYDRLDILVNNAGAIMKRKREESMDGIETTIQVNFIATFYLTALLFEKLRKSEAARIINYSSAMHKYAKINLDDFMMLKSYNILRAYGNAKLYVILFTEELNRRIQSAGIKNITVNAVHPGGVNTNFANNSSAVVRFLLKMMSPFFLTEEKGADIGIYLAEDAEAEKHSGEYFVERKAKLPAQKYNTPKIAKEVWAIAEKLTGKQFL